ncbi:hypothetical protein D3C80_1339150 [compost metagenome]
MPAPRSRSAAKFCIPRTRDSPLVSARAFSATGFDARKLAGEKASVSRRVKNSARRFTRGSTSSTLETRLFIQSEVAR